MMSIKTIILHFTYLLLTISDTIETAQLFLGLQTASVVSRQQGN